MSEKNLANALLNFEACEYSQDEVRVQTQQIIARDRRWVKAMTVVTALLWLASIGILYWFIATLIGEYTQLQQAADADPAIADIYEFLIMLGGSVEALIFALLSTVVLMYFSRRATLRQVNANLVSLSQQLEEMGSK